MIINITQVNMTDIQKKMATELQHSSLLQNASFFDFNAVTLVNSSTVPPDSSSHENFSTQYISDDSEPEVDKESDQQVTLSHNVDTLDTDSDKENYKATDSGSELDFDEPTTGHDASTNANGKERNHKVCSWNDLQSSLQGIFPKDKMYTYVVERYTELQQEDFIGAPDHAFEVQVCVNISDETGAKTWMSKMFSHSNCMHQHTRGVSNQGKRVALKHLCIVSIRRRPLLQNN